MNQSILKLFVATIFLFAFQSQAQTSRLQIIHNCPDTIVDTVDVYIDTTLIAPGFMFQTATPFMDVQAGTSFDIVITAAGQGDTTNAIFRKSFTLIDTITNVIVADGQVGNAGANGFDLRLYTGQEMSTNSGAAETSVKFIHGTYDAPMVDVYELLITEGEIFLDLSFGQDSGYADLDATDLNFQVRAQTTEVLGEFDVDLTSFEDSAIIILTTGFLDTTAAAGTTPYGLIGVFSNGNVISFPKKSITPARLQAIHNCAAIDAASIDVWLDAGPFPTLNNFNFRTCTQFLNAPAGTFFDLSICPATSADTTSAMFRQTFILESNKTYIMIASGTIGTGTYNPATPFSIDLIPDAREVADIPSDVDILFWHGATDLPTIDVSETQVGLGTFVDDIAYENSQGYSSLPPQNYDLTVQDSSGTNDLYVFDADFSSYAGKAITILASGFVSSANNNNGPGIGLWVATNTGGNLIPLGLFAGIDKTDASTSFNLYPNPAKEKIKLVGDFDDAEYKIISMNGSIVKSGRLLNSSMENIWIDNLEKGIYILQINKDSKQIIKRFTKL